MDNIIQREGLLVLVGGGVELKSSDSTRGGLTQVSIVATPRWIFLVPHIELNVAPLNPFHMLRSVGESPQALRDRLSGELDISALEQELAEALPPESRWALDQLAAHKLQGNTLSF